MRLVREERGQAVVEMALVVSLLFLLLLGIFSFGQIMHTYLTVTYAAREGARAAALGQGDAAVASAVQVALPPTLSAERLTISVTPSEGSRPRGTPIRVQVAYPVDIEVPLLAQALGRDQIVLRGETTMRAE